MEAGLDNANNPFTNSNGSLKNLDVETDNIHLQKGSEGLLLNLTDNFKANGTDLTQDIFEKSNGTKKSSSDIHFDDDFGPETDIDTVDDAFSPIENNKTFADSLSKGFNDESLPKSFTDEVKALTEGLANNNPLGDDFNPFLNKEVEDSSKESKKEEDLEEHGGDNREETPTPPVDTVHDVGGLEDNPAESDSEDEWNYIKGDQAKPETLSSQPETVVETSELEDAMSQLNPNAAEFVPHSPTRSIPSPACRALINDEVISQSPKRPVQVDIKVPNETEFETEVKSRPSDFDAYSNGHESDNEPSSSPEKMENILNGKSIDDIPEFQPGSTPAKQPAAEEFHFGPNAAPFTPKPLDQSEALSTKANYGDDTEQTLNTSFNDSELAVPHKDLGDPMSMSFSAERGEQNPFQDNDDLNKVHDLPENIDEFLKKDEEDDNKENRILNDTISDLPEHDVLGGILDNDQAVIQTTDLDKISQDDEKELASPLEPDQDDFLEAERNAHSASKTPDSNLLEDFVIVSEKTTTDHCNISSLHELEPIPQIQKEESASPIPEQHPELKTEVHSVSPVPEPLLPETKSPLPEEIDLLQSKTSIPTEEQSERIQETLIESNLLDVDDRRNDGDHDLARLESHSPVCEFKPGTKSPLDEFEVSKSPVCELKPTSDMLETEFNPKSEVENINVETKSSDLHVEATLSSDLIGELESAGAPTLACEYSAEPAVCEIRPHSREAIILESHSPIDLQEEQKHEEEVTSSVKDDLSSPIELSSPIKSPEPVIEESEPAVIKDSFVQEHEVLKTEIPPSQEIPSQDLLGDFSCPLPSSQPQIEDEPLVQKHEISVFEASAPPAEPSLLTELSNGLHNFTTEFNEQFSIKTDSIKPEFAEPAVITPSEDSKIIDEVPVAPQSEVPVQEQPLIETKPVELTEPSQEAVRELPNLEPLPIVPVALQEVKEVKKEEKKSSTASPSKKPIGKVAPSKSATTPKASTVKASPKPAASSPKPAASSPKLGVAPKVPSRIGASRSTTTAAPKTTTTSIAATKPSSKPKTATAPKSTEKKPLTNGDIKPAPRTITKKPSVELAATKTTSRPATAAPASKTSPTKTTAPRPTTAPRTVPPKPSSITHRPASASTATSKPKVPSASRTPTSAAPTTKLVSSTTTTKTTTTSTTNRTSLSPKTATAPAKPRTITNTAPKPRLPLTKTITKSAAEVEKEKKESANKLTASRTTTVTKTTSATATSRALTTTVKKTETKPLSRTGVSKTSTTTTKTTLSKKPGEVKSVTKTKTTKVEKPKENGVAPTSITEEIKEITVIKNVVNDTENLLKDISPLDNKLITETTNTLIDVNPAD